jgi:ribonuclease HII
LDKPTHTIGIDEVGRGPIAGPVAVGSFVILDKKALRLFTKVKESKQLKEKDREEWFKKIEKVRYEGLVDFSVVFQSEKIIDKKGLSFAIKNALRISLDKMVERNNLKKENIKVLLDGGLKAPKEYINQKTIIKGDEKEKIIALASICAKVLRDRKMKKFANKYPWYRFEVNKGYGTKGHYEAIDKYGLTDLHRRTFLKNRDI